MNGAAMKGLQQLLVEILKDSATALCPVTPERAKWSVVMPQPIPIVGKVMYDHMKKNNEKTVGYIGYSDSYGDLWINDLKSQTGPMGMNIVAEERFARPDTSVQGQVLKLVAANEAAVAAQAALQAPAVDPSAVGAAAPAVAVAPAH